MEPIFSEAIARLEVLHSEFVGYMAGLSIDELDWTPGPAMNSLCVLAVHVAEAERFWVGAIVDKLFERDRPAEFCASGFELAQLQLRFAKNIAFCRAEFAGLPANCLADVVDVSKYRHWPPQRFTRGWALMQAVAHSAEHVGHAGMTRQLLDARRSQGRC